MIIIRWLLCTHLYYFVTVPFLLIMVTANSHFITISGRSCFFYLVLRMTLSRGLYYYMNGFMSWLHALYDPFFSLINFWHFVVTAILVVSLSFLGVAPSLIWTLVWSVNAHWTSDLVHLGCLFCSLMITSMVFVVCGLMNHYLACRL